MDWKKGWRTGIWDELDQDWDVLIIGGGITGAGILRQCTRVGLRAVLVEAADFASGTSSRSSKLVHGGLRYLKNAQIRVTLESVQEREFLLRQGRGLVNRLGFLYACLPGDRMPGWVFGAGLMIYDLMARQWSHRSYDAEDMRELCPPLTIPGLRGGYRYFDANTDDARLVLRLLRESTLDGALAINYARVHHLLRDLSGKVCGAGIVDAAGGTDREMELHARVVINAAGAWADTLRGEIGKKSRLRPLRGSHLVLPFERLPLTRAVTFLHPEDGRPVFAIPWEGAVVFGTTDVDHRSDLVMDPSISASEQEYLLSSLQQVFPSQELTASDVIATYSGLRPVVNTGKPDPSRESREHAIWDEDGLLTVSGGKLTTFRIMARDALKAVRRHIGVTRFDRKIPMLDPVPVDAERLTGGGNIPASQILRLLSRYGPDFLALLEEARGECEKIPGTPYIWPELRQAARSEAVVHLDDLLLRRVRLGLLLPGGGIQCAEQIRPLVQNELGWDDPRWEMEWTAYEKLWHASYSFR